MASLIKNMLLKMFLLGIEQFCSCDIICGNIFFNLFASILVSIL